MAANLCLPAVAKEPAVGDTSRCADRCSLARSRWRNYRAVDLSRTRAACQAVATSLHGSPSVSSTPGRSPSAARSESHTSARRSRAAAVASRLSRFRCGWRRATSAMTGTARRGSGRPMSSRSSSKLRIARSCSARGSCSNGLSADRPLLRLPLGRRGSTSTRLCTTSADVVQSGGRPAAPRREAGRPAGRPRQQAFAATDLQGRGRRSRIARARTCPRALAEARAVPTSRLLAR